MGKQLDLGHHLRYPITVSKLLKAPGDSIKKQEPILQYKFTTVREVGDPFGEQWKEKQVTFADWDSPSDGTMRKWKIQEGMVIEKNMMFAEIEEDCPHSIQFAGLCGICGKDMTEMSWASAKNDTDRAKINMIHDQTALTVSQDEASKAEEELQRRLLRDRKLSLVVDLDQTIIHACIEPTIGEWQADPSAGNYEVLQQVKSFQLNDDGPRGLANGCNYYIKMRPGLKEFLNKVSEMYELHVYTMGTRAYALNIAKIVDPDKRLFGDRIISRDENGNMTAKSLARLFPVDTKMVVIIDDRADVWPKNRMNLIKVHPYDFFVGIGDINSTYLPKREELPKDVEIPKLKPSKPIEAAAVTSEGKTDGIGATRVSSKTPIAPTEGAKVSALEELVRMGGGDDQALRLEQAAEQENLLEKQIKERPLLHMQEQLDKEEDEADDEEAKEEVKNGETVTEHPHHKHNLLKDDDIELMYLEKHLTQIHKSFYEQYDGALVNAQGGRIAQLKPSHSRKVPIKEKAGDLSIVPDVAEVMPRIKTRTLEGCVIVMSGLVPLGVDIMRSEIALQAMSFGAVIHYKVSSKVTHLVASTSRTRTTKVKQAARREKIKIVSQQWLLNSMSKWKKEDEGPYLVHVSESDRKRAAGEEGSSPPSDMNETDDSSDDESASSGGEETDSIPSNSQDMSLELDDLAPSEDYDEGQSPVEQMNNFDWNLADAELEAFMDESDSEASDTASEISTNSGDRTPRSGEKRKYNDREESVDSDGDSDAESTLAKKQRVANKRSTGLKSLTSEQSLPTPGPTNDGEGGEDDGASKGIQEDDEDDGFDLERELMEQLENADSDGGG
ncbi:hypothetical protein HYALB_00009005 [Hymenoscyphus albidus]|uniref:RNA polymerase II subunit A C-terminal domain phosphatase n=1 Tax=Hymenoscyphus albidus TaxID=595503 RepID=A0A9N9M4C5_9HELO|nr:hypothetical protein HYALB_00009005 [Hymenoscyphus albidus]